MSYNLLPPELRNNENNIDKFTYQNTGYQNDRLNKRILNIDSGEFTSDPTGNKHSSHYKKNLELIKNVIYI